MASVMTDKEFRSGMASIVAHGTVLKATQIDSIMRRSSNTPIAASKRPYWLRDISQRMSCHRFVGTVGDFLGGKRRLNAGLKSRS